MDEEALAAALHELLDAHVLVCAADGAYASAMRSRAKRCTASCCPASAGRCTPRLAQALDAPSPEPARGAAEWAALAEHWQARSGEGAALRASIAAAAAAHTGVCLRRRQPPPRSRPRALARRSRPKTGRGSRRGRAAAPAGRRRPARRRRRDAIPAARAAVALVDPAADPRRAAALHELLGRLHRAREPALREFERALALLPAEPSPERASAMLRIGVQLATGSSRA